MNDDEPRPGATYGSFSIADSPPFWVTGSDRPEVAYVWLGDPDSGPFVAAIVSAGSATAVEYRAPWGPNPTSWSDLFMVKALAVISTRDVWASEPNHRQPTRR